MLRENAVVYSSSPIPSCVLYESRISSGAMHGLMRVRGFTQDDAHVFCTEAQFIQECLTINDLILSTYSDFGFDDIEPLLSRRSSKCNVRTMSQLRPV